MIKPGATRMVSFIRPSGPSTTSGLSLVRGPRRNYGQANGRKCLSVPHSPHSVDFFLLPVHGAQLRSAKDRSGFPRPLETTTTGDQTGRCRNSAIVPMCGRNRRPATDVRRRMLDLCSRLAQGLVLTEAYLRGTKGATTRAAIIANRFFKRIRHEMPNMTPKPATYSSVLNLSELR